MLLSPPNPGAEFEDAWTAVRTDGVRVALGCMVALLLLARPAPAQPADSLRGDSTDVAERLSRILDWQEEEHGRRTAEMLWTLAAQPLNPNHASAAELATLPGFSPSLARQIVAHRRAQGPFASREGLAAVRGLTPDRLRTAAPYLHLPTPDTTTASDGLLSVFASESGLDGRFLQRATRTLDPGRGFEADSTHHTFPGSPARLTTRLRLHYGKLRAGLTLDKDPGEAVRWHPESRTYGVDHLAGHLALEEVGPLETLIVGDYTAEYGQGLALWQGLSFGKGADPGTLVRDGRGLIPFQSTTENEFFRGLAARVSLSPRLSASAFVSRRTRDATLDTTDGSAPAPTTVRSLSSGGLHRTPGQRRREDALNMSTVGGAVQYRGARLQFGLAGYHSRFEHPLHPTNRPDRRFDLTGRRATKGSLFAHLFLDDYTLFGEVAGPAGGPYGGVAGAALSSDRGLQALLLGRWYPPSLWSLHNGAVGEAGDPQNEIGVYTGLQLPLSEHWRVGAYVDQYQFPWLRFSVPRPSWGLDTRLVSEYTPRPWLSTSLQLRAEREAAGATRKGPAARRLAGLHPTHRQSARVQAAYTFAEGVTLRTRLQGSRVHSEDGRKYGVLLAQGLRLTPIESVHLDARLAIFDTDGYEARIYAYERDLLYSFSVPVLYGEGQRSYVLVQYEPTASLTIEGKYGVTWYPHRRTIGSGLTATEGPRDREVRLQIRWRL